MDEERAKARDQILAIARRAGIPIKELLAGPTRSTSKGSTSKGSASKGGTVAVRYRHPSNSSQQWTGRGRQPAWVKEWVSAGKSLDDLRV
jgi:DNA-binding protein H-NS